MSVRDFMLPDLGEGLEDAEIVGWKVAEGDRVRLNQTLVEVNTAKALVEIPAPWDGIVEMLHASEGDVVKVGAPLVSIRIEAGEPSEQSSAPATAEDRPKRRAVLVGYGVEEEEERVPRRRPAEQGTGEGGERLDRDGGPVPASPPVRRLARELGIDLAAVTGSGPGGRVTRDDLMKARDEGIGLPAEAAPHGARESDREAWTEGADEDQVIPVRGTRRLIAEKMARSIREIPHVTTFLTVDATWMQAFREEVARSAGRRVSPLPIVVRALVEVCRDFPKLNASFQAERSEILLHRSCHVGIATDTEKGLLVPVIRDARDKGVAELAGEIARLSERARAGTIKPEEMAGGTITVTNVGTFGSDFGTPIINYPEAAVLALGVVEPRALVVDGRVEARPAVTLSLSFDHRILDGAEAGRALRSLGDILTDPFRLGALPR
jgi:2-oxoisovalerate dehydrogenase E2 component (dihydrolipoyl transacylase)